MVYDYEAFKKDVYALTDINLDLYKEKQMKRRIESLIKRHGYQDFESFMQGLRKDAALLDAFINHLTINVSEFYRNPGQWEFFEKEILPYLMKKYGDRLTVWSAACSTGDEPYTIAMILAKHLPLANIKIYATDIDEAVLKKAQAGIYSERSLAGLPRDFLKQHFQQVNNGRFYQISNEIKRCVEFKKHNLLEDKYPSDCHLVVCRNVVIYFTEEAKEMVYKGFHRSLVRDGILFIGSTEQIIDARQLGFAPFKSFFYQAVPVGSGVEADISHQKSSTLAQRSTPDQKGTLAQRSTPDQKSTLAQRSTPDQKSTLAKRSTLDRQGSTIAKRSTSDRQGSTIAQRSASNRQGSTIAQRSTSNQQSSTLAQRSTSNRQSSTLAQRSTSNRQGSTIAQRSASDRQGSTLAQRNSTLASHTENRHMPERTTLSGDRGRGERN